MKYKIIDFLYLLIICDLSNFQTRICALITGETCGKVQIGRGNIVGGNYAIRGSFPWSAALVKNDGSVFCGGTIVSKNKVLTAAHCVLGKDNLYELLSREIIVVVGGHNLNITFERGRFSVGVERIDIHDDWNPSSSSFDADIAMLTLVDNLCFNRYIQPICLIHPYSFLTRIWNGYTVGYGKSERNSYSENVLKSVLIPIEPSNEECFYSNEFLVKIASNRSFCGGSREGSGVCLGDSGNGLFAEYSGIYYLRGIVSASLYTNNNCDVYNYAIFTNVIKFFDWIVDKAAIMDYQYISKTSISLLKRGDALCTYEHVTKYQNELILEPSTGYKCSLDIDVQVARVNKIFGSHRNDGDDNKVSIINILSKFNNYLTTFPNTFCNKFPKLEIIDMSRSYHIETIENDSLIQCKNLKILQFHMNRIEKLPENLLAENKRMKKLYITSNLIKRIPNNFLSNLLELQIMDLSNNKIDQISSNTFNNIVNLEELNLASNNLKVLDRMLFKNLKKLKKLNLNNNEITELSEGVFSNLDKLKHFFIQKNKLTIIHAASFPRNVHLDIVDLSRNQIIAIDEQFIQNCDISNLKMAENTCDETTSIKKMEMKLKLASCFSRYINPISVITIIQKPTLQSVSKLPEAPKCGFYLGDKIYGGEDTMIDDYPWVAQILYTKPKNKIGSHCGGILINERYVLSAAQCEKQIPATWKLTAVRFGDWDTRTNPDCQTLKNEVICNDPYVDVDVIQAIVHPEYVEKSKNLHNDIMLLKLENDVQYTKWIQPICLPIDSSFRGMNFANISLEFSGFGKTIMGNKAEIKKKIQLDGVDRCGRFYESQRINITSKQICAGSEGKGACVGDSGGPLMRYGNFPNSKYPYYLLVGIVSFGPKYCGTKDAPGVYTKVSEYIDWINSNTN